MKHRYLLLLVVIISSVIASCQKIPGHAVTPSGGSSTGTGTGSGTGGVITGTTYHTSTMYNTGPVRVFTKSGEVLDTAVIGRLARAYFTGQGSGNTYLKGYNGAYHDGPFSIQLGNGTAAITDNSTYIATKTKTTGSDIRMTTKDSIIDVLYDPNDVYMYNFKKDMGKNLPTYDVLFAPGQGGNPFNGYARNYLSDYYATQSGVTLLYPTIFGTAVIDTSSPGIIGTTSIGFIMNNKFSGVAGTHLKTTDTVVFQEFNVVLVK
jgi:hypothetical protein